jgi:hypothetical protein
LCGISIIGTSLFPSCNFQIESERPYNQRVLSSRGGSEMHAAQSFEVTWPTNVSAREASVCYYGTELSFLSVSFSAGTSYVVLTTEYGCSLVHECH